MHGIEDRTHLGVSVLGDGPLSVVFEVTFAASRGGGKAIPKEHLRVCWIRLGVLGVCSYRLEQDHTDNDHRNTTTLWPAP